MKPFNIAPRNRKVGLWKHQQKNLNPAEQAVLDEARKVNEERMQAIQDLAAIVAQRIDLEERLKDNAKQERRAIREAEKAGWTPAQIKRFMKPPRTQSRPSPTKTMK